MVAPIEITIGGQPITTAEQASVSIDNILGQTIDTAKITVFDRDANIEIPEAVDVIITRTDTGQRIFGGLSSVVEGSTAGLSRRWDVQCQDYTVLLDTGLVHCSYQSGFTYDGLSGDRAIIAHLFEMAGVNLMGSGASEIEARTYVGQAFIDTDMGSMFFNYNTYREAIQTIASYAGWNYHVDYYKHLHYYYRDNTPAPYRLSSTPGPGNITYRKIRWRRDGTAIRNLFIMFGARLFSSEQHYYLKGDRYFLDDEGNACYTLGIEDIGRNVSLVAPPGKDHILVDVNMGTDQNPNWVPQSVGIEGFDNLDAVDCLHNSLHQVLIFKVPPPNLNNAIFIRAVYLIGAGQADAEDGSIAKYGRTFARRLSAGDTNSAIAIGWKLNSYKEQFAYAMEKITLTIDDTEFPGTDRFEAGQWVQLDNGTLGLNRSYLIHRVTTRILGGSHLEYELELRSWVTDVAN